MNQYVRLTHEVIAVVTDLIYGDTTKTWGGLSTVITI